MKKSNQIKLVLRAAFFVSLLKPVNHIAKADTPTTFDIEIDPLAYAFQGYSGHLGLSGRLGRLDLGAFGAKIPNAFLKNSSFSAQFRGIGIKWDKQPVTLSGLFYGIETSIAKLTYTHISTYSKITRTEKTIGGRVGFRFEQSGFTVSPWVGIGYNADSKPIIVNGDEFKNSPWVVFPTVHIGWIF